MFAPKGKTEAVFCLSPFVPLSPASGEIFNIKWRGGDRG